MARQGGASRLGGCRHEDVGTGISEHPEDPGRRGCDHGRHHQGDGPFRLVIQRR